MNNFGKLGDEGKSGNGLGQVSPLSFVSAF
jgi:hypothetical protein